GGDITGVVDDEDLPGFTCLNGLATDSSSRSYDPQHISEQQKQQQQQQESACSPRKAFLYQQQDALLQCEKEAMQEEMIDSVRGGAKVHLSSVIYIDCASPDDQGRYQLDVRTPAGHLFTRYFTVQLLENVDRMLGHTCRLGKEVMSFVPRIYQFARQAVAQHGQTLVLANGDLLVRDLSPKDRGVYTCRAHNTDLPGIADQIHTFVYPQEKDRV
ncbi:putative sidekick-like, partial [Homarus americanus]